MFSSLDYLIMPALACMAVGLDFALGEPKRYHPLIGFGWLAKQLDHQLNPKRKWSSTTQRYVGLFGLTTLIAPCILIAVACKQRLAISAGTDVILLYFALGHKSLHEHVAAVHDALKCNDIEAAKIAASYMVSRDSSAIEPAAATVESVLENGNDGVFGALFWFFVAGGVGALLFRLINTMDAMWGYKTARYYYFGWAAAKLDDVVSYLPARLTALTYTLLGHTRTALHCWRHQAPLWDSPNAGPVMASGAGALRVQLGGPACYHGEWHQRPILGEGHRATPVDIDHALTLVRHGVYCWLVLALLIAGILDFLYA